ncbi:MAG: ThuA domain-containing protein, partial [Planctomycetes bacterium]|nr:ThuA domain-containing protein [Planctomycetota bacterium]
VRVLLVTGVDYVGHHWKETAPALRGVLEKDSRLEVRVIEDHEFLASDVIFDYDVILLHLKNYEPTKRAEQVRGNLTRFVSDGGGLVLYHFALGAFEPWKEFEQLAGRTWDQTKRGHDPRGPFTVNIIDHDHPVTSGMDDFETDDELYTCLGGQTPIHVLATARSKVDGQDYPMAFVLDYGKGRVFHTPLGHDVKAVTMPGPAELIRRGCLWAAGRQP